MSNEKKDMKIALFHEVQHGGARRGANEFAKALRKKGHTVDLYLVDKKNDEKERDYYDNIFFYKFISKDWNGGNWKMKLYKDTLEIFHIYVLHKKIARDIEKRKYDLAFVHPSQYTQAPFVLRMLHIPTLYYCQEPLRMIYEKGMDSTDRLDFFRKRYERSIRKIRKIIDKKNISSATIIFANSTFTQKNIYDAYGLRSIVCHMGVDTNRFFETTTKKDIDILYIGSRDVVDGFDIFEKTRKLFKEQFSMEYLLRGEKWLHNDKELRDYYSRAKVVLCFGKNEPFGLIPLEAMSCGAVIVGLDSGGYKDSIIQGKTGMRVSEDPHEIAKVLTTVLTNDTLLKSMSQNAKKDIRVHWLWEKSANAIISQYKIWQKTQT